MAADWSAHCPIGLELDSCKFAWTRIRLVGRHVVVVVVVDKIGGRQICLSKQLANNTGLEPESWIASKQNDDVIRIWLHSHCCWCWPNDDGGGRRFELRASLSLANR